MSAPRPSDFAARAAALTARAAALGEAQAAVATAAHEEATALAGALVPFFDRLPLREFPGLLLPRTAQAERRMRHKVLRESRRQEGAGAEATFLLFGRDGVLRAFTLRSTSALDLDDTLATARPVGEVRRELVEWTPRTRQLAHGAAEVLGVLTRLVDEVERRLAAAESRVAAQAIAFGSGDRARIAASLAPAPHAPAPPAADATPSPGADSSSVVVTPPPPPEPSWLTRAVRAGSRTPSAAAPGTP